MKDNNKIDNLFRARIPQKDELPPEEMWGNIESRLSKLEGDRRLIIPLWFKLAGVAAVIILIVSLFNEPNAPLINSPLITDMPVDKSSDQNEEVVEENRTKTPAKLENDISGKNNTAVTEASTVVQPGGNKDDFFIVYGEKEKERTKIKSFEVTFNSGISARDSFGFTFAILNPSLLTMQENNIENLKSNYDEKFNEPEEVTIDNIPLKNRFSVAPTIAAIYTGNIGSGNALDNNFAGNPNQGSVNMSYGVSLAYQISKNTRIRSGINTINLNSTTRQVDNELVLTSSSLDGGTLASGAIPAGTGDLNQHLGFLEIPLELDLAVVNRKLGIHLIGGVSTYFVQKNEVQLNSAVLNTNLGPANNVNETSFSANMGVGFSYRFNSRFHFNLDPVIKYQINTYENVSNYKPYLLGVYTGFRLKL